MKSKNKLDEFHYHEAMDRMMLIADLLENQVEHAVFQKHKKYRKDLEKSISILYDLYQKIGTKRFERFEKFNKDKKWRY